MLGRVTCQNTSQSVAPRVRAASSSAGSICSSTGMSSRTTKGSVTKSVASAMPAGTQQWCTIGNEALYKLCKCGALQMPAVKHACHSCRACAIVYNIGIKCRQARCMQAQGSQVLHACTYHCHCTLLPSFSHMLTWESKNNTEACSLENGGKPAFPSIQQHQHQSCNISKCWQIWNFLKWAVECSTWLAPFLQRKKQQLSGSELISLTACVVLTCDDRRY